MNLNTIRRLRTVFVLPLLMLAVGCDIGSSVLSETETADTVSEAFMIESRQVTVSEALLEGTFKASGMLEDRGTVREVLDSLAPLHQRGSIYGAKTLASEKGTIRIEFYASLIRLDERTLRAVGGFVIVAGTGTYTDLQGGGEIDLELATDASAAELTEVLEGEAQYVR